MIVRRDTQHPSGCAPTLRARWRSGAKWRRRPRCAAAWTRDETVVVVAEQHAQSQRNLLNEAQRRAHGEAPQQTEVGVARARRRRDEGARGGAQRRAGRRAGRAAAGAA